MSLTRGILCGGLLALCQAAQGAIAFSFADPGGGHQLTNTANGGGPGIGMLHYSTTDAITLIVDGAASGVGSATFTNARLEMANLTLGAAQTQNGITTAPVAGSFTFYDFTGNVRVNILTANVAQGSYVRIGATNALLFSSALGLVYTPGPRLQSLLSTGQSLGNPQEATFTLTDVTTVGGAPLIGAGGVFSSFDCNASFSGNTQVIPAPASIALLALAGLVSRRRRALA